MFCIESPEDRPKSFVWYSQVFSDRTATRFKSTRLVVYPWHVVNMNSPPSCQCWLIGNSLILLGFLPEPMKRWEDNVDSREVGQKFSTHWFTGTNDAEMEETRRQPGPLVMYE